MDSNFIDRLVNKKGLNPNVLATYIPIVISNQERISNSQEKLEVKLEEVIKEMQEETKHTIFAINKLTNVVDQFENKLNNANEKTQLQIKEFAEYKKKIDLKIQKIVDTLNDHQYAVDIVRKGKENKEDITKEITKWIILTLIAAILGLTVTGFFAYSRIQQRENNMEEAIEKLLEQRLP